MLYVFWFRINKQIRIYDVNKTKLFGGNVVVFNQRTFYHKPREFQITSLFGHYIIKDKKSLPITGLEATTSVIAGKCLNECATAASIYIDLR